MGGKQGTFVMSSPENGNALDLFELLRRKAPEYLDLLTSETNEEFESAFTTLLGKAISHLEKNKKKFASLDEEGLSGVLAGTLTIPGMTVTQETNSNGHVDLTIEADHCTPSRIKLGEAKIYSGAAYHIKGLGQLIGRYTTGRESSGLLISYVRKKDIKTITETLKVQMNRDLPEQQVGESKDHALKWSFITSHEHSSGEVVEVAHIGCNLF
jgi:hypothetical protein